MDRYAVAEGIDDPLRRMLETALQELEHLRDRGHEAVQYPEVDGYRIDGGEVYDHAQAGADALFEAVRHISGTPSGR